MYRKRAILANETFDFLKDIVETVNDDGDAGAGASGESKKKKRKTEKEVADESE